MLIFNLSSFRRAKRVKAFREWLEVSMDLSTYRSAASTCVMSPLFSEQYYGTHAWPSHTAKRGSDCNVVPRDLELVHMAAVQIILNKENKSSYNHQKDRLYNIVRKKFSTARRRWKQKV